MDYRWKNIATFVLFVASVIVVLPWDNKPIIGDQGFVLGLDLQGGTQMLLNLDYDKQNLKPTEMNESTRQAQEILTQRINQYGLTQPRIQKMGPDQILVQIPGLDPSRLDRVKEVLRTTGNLKFYLRAPDVQQSKAGEPVPGDPYQNAPDGTMWLPVNEEAGSIGSSRHPNYLLVEEEPKLSGEHVEEASTQMSTRGSGYKINLNLTPDGGSKFAEVTRANEGRVLAIALDSEVLSAPRINEAITGGRAEITGDFSIERAKVLTTALNSGRLKAPIRIIHENSVGPSLGEASIQRGRWAVLSALGVIILFMILYYWGLGVVVSFVLVLNLLLLGSLLLLLKATLTLPGIAGIILTVGMAVDASVIIFERIREESEKDQSARKAFETAWNNAFYAVFDANITTLIAAIILFYFGSQAIRGFATTLFLGILTTLFTVFFSEKAIIQGLIGMGAVKNFRQLKWFTNTNFNFLNKAKGMFALSGVAVLLSIGVFGYGAAQGGKIFGLDFTGGQLLNLRFEKTVRASEVRERLENLDVNGFHPYAGVEIQQIRTGETTEKEPSAATAPAQKRSSDAKTNGTSPSDAETSGDSGKRTQMTYTYQLRLKGSRLDRVVGEYLRTDLAQIFEESGNAVSSLQMEEDRAVFELENMATLNSLRRKLHQFQHENTRIRPYHGLSVSIPGKDAPEGSTEARQFEIEITNTLTQQYLKHDLLQLFGNDLAPRRDVVLAGTNRFSFRIALASERPVDSVRSSIHKLFEDQDIDIKPLVEPVSSGDETEPERTRLYDITIHQDVERQVRNNYDQLVDRMNERIGLSEGPFGGRVVSMSATVADSFKRDAFWAISLSWIAILLYLAMRFQFAYGVGAVIALVHDVIVCVGVVALVDLLLPPQLGVNLDIGMASLAAFLTVVGYSVNDSIVTYDRIRELIRDSRKKTLGVMIDESINLNFSRTVLTSVTTFIAAVLLFAFTANTGTDVASFAFPIIIGVLTGTYSSMFLASPLLIYAPLVGQSEDTRASRMHG